jgi:hypothetical protein
MCSLALIIFVVSEKKAFEHFPIGSNVNLCIAVVAILDFMNVHGMVLYKLYVFCSDVKFKMAATAGLSLTLDPMGKMSIGSNVKLSPAVAAILNFISEQKTLRL